MPAPAAEAEVSVKNETQPPSDNDDIWSDLKSASTTGTMSFFGTNTGSTPTPQSTDPAKNEKKVYYLGVHRVQANQAEELVADRDLSSFGRFTAGQFNDALTFTSKTFATRTDVGQRQRVEEKNAAIYTYNTSMGFCVVLITEANAKDGEFYDLPANVILSKTADGFKTRFAPPKNIRTDPPSTFQWPELKTLRAEATKVHLTGISAVQREVNETKEILHKTIEQVMQRGEKLDDLVAKSDDLGIAAKSFYKTAQKQNSCCVVM